MSAPAVKPAAKTDVSNATTGNWRRVATFSGPLWLLVGALVALAGGYAAMDATVHSWSAFLHCSGYAPRMFCAFAFPSHATMLMALGAAALLAICRPEIVRTVVGATRARPSLGWIAVHAAGLGAVFGAPSLFLATDAPASFWAGVSLSVLGVATWLVGAMFAVAPPRAWAAAARRAGIALPVVAALVFLAKPLASSAEWIWYEGSLAFATFQTVASVLEAMGFDATVAPRTFEIVVDEFGVMVDRQCSGVEGFVLITSFLTIYGVLFRDQLRLDRFLLLFPIGVAVSWCFNVVRIVTLIVIGANGYPELAINGFHSHAGWLMFVLVSLSLALAAHGLPWFRRAPAIDVAAPAAPAQAPPRALPPFFEDMKAAEILPFMVFMLSALVASTFSETPNLYYPLRFVAVLAVLWLFRGVLARIDWRVDPLSVAVGAAIGVAWVATAPVASDGDAALRAALDATPLAVFALWVATRLLGTAVLVPLVEELFFRGYLLRLFGDDRPARLALGIVVSTLLFAALHDRWLAAGLAGAIFAALALRRGKIADAIYGHAAANALIAAWALSDGDWSVI